MRRVWLIALATVLVITACASPSAPSPNTAPGSGAPAPAAAPAAPKRITIALAREVGALVRGFGGGLSSDAGAARDMAHDYLVQIDVNGALIPRVASSVISVEDGSWRVNPDGSMDTTWKLRPDVKWHDGTPLTADDVIFATETFKDPQATPPDGQANRLMESLTATDPHTLQIHWSAIYVDANGAPNLTPLPKHLLGDLFNSDRDAFFNSPYFNTEFVGLGPYKVLQWDRGSSVEFAAFDQYYQGRPRIDRVVLKFLPDPNTMVANVLSETVDVILNSTADADISLAADVENRWQGTGNKVIYRGGGGVGRLEIQLRPEFAKPQNGLPDRTVRQAMYHATDRPTYNQVVNLGKSEVADSWVSRQDALRSSVESAIPQYPFDLNRAQQLFTQAGWTKGADGVLVHGPTGERFAIVMHGPAGTSTERKLNVLADSWKAVGMEISFNLIPSTTYNDLDYRTHLPGSGLSSISGDGFAGGRNYLHTKTISAPSNRWTGANRSGYSNPRVDSVLDQLAVTIDDRQRVPLHRELLTEVWTDVPFIPLEFTVTPVLHLRRVTGIPGGGGGSTTTVNIFQWDVQG